MKIRQTKSPWFTPLLPPLISFAAATLGGAALLLISGHNVIVAFSALVGGAFGSLNNLAETLLKSTPLLLCGLAVTVAFRAGIWNIGAEGQFLAGALLAAALAPILYELPSLVAVPLLLSAGAIAGAAWGALPGWMKARRHIQEVISTILLNFIAIELIRYAVHGPLIEAGGNFPQSAALPENLRLVRMMAPTRLHLGVPLAGVMAILTQVFLFRTTAGYQLRALGANPNAARFAGMQVERLTIMTMAISGGIAGLAGAVELSGVTHRVFDNFSPGYGYTAVAVALMARLNPLSTLVTALFFGALEAGAGAMQRAANVSAVVVAVMQGLVILSIATTGALQVRRAKRKIGADVRPATTESEPSSAEVEDEW
jgi:simple sugar transport system permease protein